MDRRHQRWIEIAIVIAGVVSAVGGCTDAPAQRDGPDAGDAFAPDADGSNAPEEFDAGDTATAHTDGGANATGDASGGPPYPIVLAHGLGGFEHLADAERFSYYFRVPEALRDRGEVVFVPEVEPFNDSYDRGDQLLEQIEGFLADHPAEKANIIGHSQGALDARYVAHHRPEMVASVVMISGPNRGTPIADISLQFVEHDWAQDIIDEMVELTGRTFYDSAGEETSLFDAFEQFSEEGIAAFNDEITDQPGVYYASIAGVTDIEPDGPACEPDRKLDFIWKWRETDDAVDPTFSLTERVLDGGQGRRPNDGLVRVRDAKWGEFLGCIPADHLDEIGQIAGDPPGGDNPWDYREFYVELVEYLHREGY